MLVGKHPKRIDGNTVAMDADDPRWNNLLSDLPSLSRMSKHDQRRLESRLRRLAGDAKADNAISVAANLLRASYELDGPSR